MSKIALVFGGVFILGISYAQFPGCPSVNAGNDVNLTCADPCVQLNASVFESGATDSYSVSAIAHTPPIAYNEPGGNPVSVNTDDVWSPTINLPFDFCFYGQNYTTVKVGSNGALELGPAISGGVHPWSYTASVPSPNLISAGHIYGIYHDIDPTVNGTVQWYLTGVAPCRIFVVVYNDLGHFSCTSLRSTFMMVLYETTNAIDVYVAEKETCGSWNLGNAVIGIQNSTGTTGIAAPGRNTGSWTVSAPEAWRFSPNGSPIYAVEWFEGANSIGTGNTVNVCPTTPTNYTAVATYLACDGQAIVVEDDVLVTPPANAPNLNVSSITPATCEQDNGQVSVTASGGTPGYQYSIDGLNYQASGSFSGLAIGNYTVSVQDNTGCIGAVNIEITENSTLDLTVTSQDISCFGLSNGSISVNGVNGAGGYTYAINGGAPQASGTFSNLPSGNYGVEVIDQDGCVSEDSISIVEPTELNITLIDSENISCAGENDGFITVSASGGTGVLVYEVIPDSTQSTGLFENLLAGIYNVTVIDENGCETIEIVELTEPTPTPTSIDYGGNGFCQEGSITVTVDGINGGSFSSSVGLSIVPNTGEINLENSFLGNYTVVYSYVEGGCAYTAETQVEIFEFPNINAGVDTTICEGDSYVFSANGGVSYVWNNGISNGDQIIPNVGTYNYEVTGTDANGCTTVDTLVLTVNPSPTVIFTANPTQGFVPLEVTFENESTGATAYTWNFGNGFSNNSTASILEQTYNEPGTYVVILTGNENGCEQTFTITIIAEYVPIIFDIPNVFSPNNDGSNDYFMLVEKSGLENMTNFNLIILNRWGNVIQTYTDAFFKWDGKTEGGKDVSEGTYFYKLTATGNDNEEIIKHGFVQLIRN